MTSIPASRSARAMIFAPRSCPSRPGLATTTRILRAVAVLIAGGRLALTLLRASPSPSQLLVVRRPEPDCPLWSNGRRDQLPQDPEDFIQSFIVLSQLRTRISFQLIEAFLQLRVA